MIIETMEVNSSNKAHYPSRKAMNFIKVIEYILDSEDTSVIKNDVIKKIIKIGGTRMYRVVTEDFSFEMNKDSLKWLETHHYMQVAISKKETLESMWDKIKDDVDLFVIDSYYIDRWLKSYSVYSDISYDKKNIKVGNINTNIPPTLENVQFIAQNIQKWRLDD